ncbi:MAG: ATP-dependent helicase HrpB [Pseudomonadota bacterium]|nr:ATP-dependent helicase HrpB [Pseudomonadota bacterium]
MKNNFLKRDDVRELAVLELLPELRRTLQVGQQVVLQAPPGSGKTTLLPLLLRDEPWLEGLKIVMLEPRRLAARAAARRMAALLGEEVGETVGFRVRHESVVGRRTRIEVVTEGVLTRYLQNDPALSDYGLVIFDEFHERHLQADLGLAFTLQVQELLRSELKLMVMSATLAALEIAEFLGGAPLLEAKLVPFPVTTFHAENSLAKLSLPVVARTVVRALYETSGDLLVFLPGAGEIRRLAELLREVGRQQENDSAVVPKVEPKIEIIPLYGNLPRELQDRAFQFSQKRVSPKGASPKEASMCRPRKVVLATDIAESSLTVPGVRVVVDSGWRRIMRFDPASGMGRLETVKISRAAADQRRGRAAREGPGCCYRLWSKSDEPAMLKFSQPEIRLADLASMVLEMAAWGVSQVTDLRWLTPPSQALVDTALTLLRRLGAVDADNRITEHGRELAKLGIHPRLAQMLLAGKKIGQGRLAALLAALLNERDPLSSGDRFSDCDIDLRLDLLVADDKSHTPVRVERALLKTLRREAQRLTRQLKIVEKGPLTTDFSGELLAFAYPDRIAKKRSLRDDDLRFLLSGGQEAAFAYPEPLSHSSYLVVARLAGDRRKSRIRLASAYSESSLRKQFSDLLKRESQVFWDQKSGSVVARQQLMLDSLILEEGFLKDPSAETVAAAWLEGVRRVGLDLLPWNKNIRQWCRRIEFVRNNGLVDQDIWPACDDSSLLDEVEVWLAPRLGRIRNRDGLDRLDLKTILRDRLSWQQQQKLEQLAPVEIRLPSGRYVQLDYTSGAVPVLAARVQELFGCRETPRIGGGRIALLLHILSPARRPVQVTDDLAGFWHGSYREVRKEMRGRYPKHAWPEEPWLE